MDGVVFYFKKINSLFVCLIITVVVVIYNYMCECTVGVDVRDGTTSLLISILKKTQGIRPRLGCCDDPNHRWWTGANRPRFTTLAVLTKVRPPLCIPTDRVFHPVCKGVPDPNLVYPLLSTRCLPSLAAGTARFSGLDPTPVTRVTTAFKHVQIAIARYGGVMHHKCTRVQAAHPLLWCYSFNNRVHRLRRLQLRG
jgi:hypothetical protein